MLRGGSWNNNPRNLRSANRNRNRPDNRNNNNGFRVARTLKCPNRRSQGVVERVCERPGTVMMTRLPHLSCLVAMRGRDAESFKGIVLSHGN
ncbi:MAG: hypothetical protein OXD44_11075 [Gammaproteobacteria bacterium]|nr:hypothetical protein [Gammaproteobacteria bacterium]MCY4227817.1 hypothetical protein [Gammaproteobacteria bacterium]MCY4314208.1 hypothetical protein [Gammaproteobacteria bacterium]